MRSLQSKPTTTFSTAAYIFPGLDFFATQRNGQRNPSRSLDRLQRRRQPREEKFTDFRKLHGEQAEHRNRPGGNKFQPEIPAQFAAGCAKPTPQYRNAMRFFVNSTDRH